MISPLVGEDSNHGGNEELVPATNHGGNLQFGLRVSISTCVRRIIWFGPAARLGSWHTKQSEDNTLFS